MGLATVYGIVKQSGGAIWVYSEPGIGTAFKLYFPASVGTAQTRIQPEKQSVLQGHGELIFVVEDTAALLDVMAESLEKTGYTVERFESPLEALHRIEKDQARPGLLITDLIMPNMNGRELAERVANSHRDLRVLYMSGYTDDTALRLGISNSGRNFIQKPFSRLEFLRKVRTILDSDVFEAERKNGD